MAGAPFNDPSEGLPGAKRVLPAFMWHSRSLNPESIASEGRAIQILGHPKPPQITHGDEPNGGTPLN